MSALEPLVHRSPVDDATPLLNWDVLTETMSFSTRADAGRMSRTCCTLLQAAPRILLKGTVTLSTSPQCMSFFQFMSRKGRENCFRYLRRLGIPVWGLELSPRGQRLLATLFIEATELEWLDLGGGYFMWMDERIPQAIAAMRNLRTLHLQSPTKRAYDLLTKMQPLLTAVDADFWGYGAHPMDPVVVFAPFKDTLEDMKVSWIFFNNRDSQFPLVTTLAAEQCRGPSLRTLTHCFPNLQGLHYTVGALDRWRSLDYWRSENMASQALVRWPLLTWLSGNIVGLYMLGVRTNVNHLCVASSALVTVDDSRQLRAVLSCVQGLQSLYLKVKVPDFDVSSVARVLAPAKTTLAELMLRLEYHGERNGDLRSQTSAMLESLSGFPLHTLRICIKWHYNGPAEGSSSNLDHVVIAEHAMSCIPSVRHIYLEIEPSSGMFEVQSRLEGDGRLRKCLQPLEGWNYPDTLFSNNFLESWRHMTDGEVDTTMSVD